MAVIAIAGVTVGFHRHLTHGSFKARRPLRIALAVAGSLAVEGAPTKWVADHRRHHAFADREGDPHSPWRYGTGVLALTKRLLYAHCGWLLNREVTNKARFATDLVADRGIRVVDRLFIPLIVVSRLVPAATGGLVTGSWTGALTGFFRAGFWPLAILSFGESWHNSHHADPTIAGHGVLRRQIDPAARLIRLFERAGWAVPCGGRALPASPGTEPTDKDDRAAEHAEEAATERTDPREPPAADTSVGPDHTVDKSGVAVR